MDKILCFTTTVIIVIKRQEKRPHVLVDIPNCLQAKPMKSGTWKIFLLLSSSFISTCETSITSSVTIITVGQASNKMFEMDVCRKINGKDRNNFTYLLWAQFLSELMCERKVLIFMHYIIANNKHLLIPFVKHLYFHVSGISAQLWEMTLKICLCWCGHFC